MMKKIKTRIVVILLVTMFIVTMFSGSAMISTSGDEQCTSNSHRLGN